MKYRFPIYLFIALLLSGCVTIPEPADFLGTLPFMKSKQQKEGEAALVAGDYESAVNLLQQAAVEKPDDKEIKAQLTEARSKAAELHFVRADQAEQNNNPRLAVAEFEKAFQYKETPAIRARLAQARSDLSTLTTRVAATISALNSPQSRVEAIGQAEELMVYQQSFPKLEPALSDARKQVAISFNNQANQLLRQRKFTKALAVAKQAAEFSHEANYQTQVKAFEDLLKAREKTRANDLVAALAFATQAKKLLPENSVVAQYQSELLDDSSGQLFNEAMRASRSGHYLDAIERLEMLQALNPDFAETDQQLRMNRLRFSNENRLQAEALEQSDGNQAAGRILIHYLVAQHYDPRSYELEDAVLQARKRLSNEIELRVSIDFANESREPGANTYVRDRVLDGLRDSNISNLMILEREAIDEILREQGLGQGFLDESTTLQVKKIRGIQTGVKGSVLRVVVHKSGRERPSYGSVRYQSGTRLVANPAYRNRQADVNSARREVYQAQQALNQALAKKQNTPAYRHDPSKSAVQNQLGLLSKVMSDGEISGAENDLYRAQSSLNSAENSLTREPSQIEEPVYADARYPIYNLRLDGEVQISFRLIDFTTSEIGRSHNIHIKDSVSDRYIAGDPGKGIADDPDELPPSHVFKEQLMNRAVKETIEKLNAEFSRYSQRFLKQARRAREHKVSDEAAEYYFRYLAAISGDSGDEVKEAQQYIESQYGAAVAP